MSAKPILPLSRLGHTPLTPRWRDGQQTFTPAIIHLPTQPFLCHFLSSNLLNSYETFLSHYNLTGLVRVLFQFRNYTWIDLRPFRDTFTRRVCLCLLLWIRARCWRLTVVVPGKVKSLHVTDSLLSVETTCSLEWTNNENFFPLQTDLWDIQDI